MKYKIFIFLPVIFICLLGCSSSYEQLSKNSIVPSDRFSKQLLNEYKIKADYEASEMHDWNSAKLYSEKALSAIKGNKIKPQKINYWDIPKENIPELEKAYKNLMKVYTDAIQSNPKDLAKAISSLDCWSEQQEEIWQISHIKKCKSNFITAMHNIFNTLKEQDDKISNSNANNNDSVSVITKNSVDEILQIIYFDFDKFRLSDTNLNELKNFLERNDKNINKYLVVGHTDTKGTKNYNYKLSLQRAKSVKKILLQNGISNENIKIIAEGENSLLVKTPNETAHPANRRVEISPIN